MYHKTQNVPDSIMKNSVNNSMNNSMNNSINNSMNNSLSARTHSAGRHQVLGKILYSLGNILFIRFKFLASRSFRHISLIPGKWLIFWKYTKILNIHNENIIKLSIIFWILQKTFCKSCFVWIIIYDKLHTSVEETSYQNFFFVLASNISQILRTVVISHIPGTSSSPWPVPGPLSSPSSTESSPRHQTPP